MTKKTLLIPGDFPPEVSGIATYFHEIWKFYDSKQHYILAAQYKNAKKFDSQSNLSIIRTTVPTGNNQLSKIFKSLVYFFRTLFLHFNHRFSLIHCGQVLSSGLTGWLMNRLFNIPYVIYVYGSETYRFGNNKQLMKLIQIVLNNAALIIPNSEFTMTEFLQLGIDRHKFKIITPGVDTKRFSPALPDSDLVKKYHLKDKKVLLTVARLDERKGHDKMIEAIAQLKKDIPNIVYLIVGKGREKSRLEKLVNQYNVTDNVIFCGYVADNDLPKYYNLCDVFVLLNRQTKTDEALSGDYEGFGIVFLEASACGKPVIAGNFGGIRDAVQDNQSGFIIDGTNLEEITAVTRKLLTSKALNSKIGIIGRSRVEKSFQWQIISRKLAQAIKDI